MGGGGSGARVPLFLNYSGVQQEILLCPCKISIRGVKKSLARMRRLPFPQGKGA